MLGRRVTERDLGRQRQTGMRSRTELFSLTLPTAFSDGPELSPGVSRTELFSLTLPTTFSDGLVRVKSGC